jgi:hypothetical protein
MDGKMGVEGTNSYIKCGSRHTIEKCMLDIRIALVTQAQVKGLLL